MIQARGDIRLKKWHSAERIRNQRIDRWAEKEFKRIMAQIELIRLPPLDDIDLQFEIAREAIRMSNAFWEKSEVRRDSQPITPGDFLAARKGRDDFEWWARDKGIRIGSSNEARRQRLFSIYLAETEVEVTPPFEWQLWENDHE